MEGSAQEKAKGALEALRAVHHAKVAAVSQGAPGERAAALARLPAGLRDSPAFRDLVTRQSRAD